MRFAVGAAVLLAACGRNRAVSEVRYDGADNAILVAAVMPRCGCLALTNIGTQESSPGGVEVVASFAGQVTGSTLIPFRQEHIEKFDWAGPSEGEAYEIAAYARRGDGSRGERLTPISRYVRFPQKASMCQCDESACAFGSLALNAALNARPQ